MSEIHRFCDILKNRACRDLWRAVIHLALNDAVDKSKKYELEHYEALTWIERGGKDFKLACDMAGYDPSDVQGKLATYRYNRQTQNRGIVK